MHHPKPKISVICEDKEELTRVLNALRGVTDKVDVSEDPYKYYREWQKNRYHTNPEYREKTLEVKKEKYKAKYADNPDYKAARAQYSRERYRKKKEEALLTANAAVAATN